MAIMFVSCSVNKLVLLMVVLKQLITAINRFLRKDIIGYIH